MSGALMFLSKVIRESLVKEKMGFSWSIDVEPPTANPRYRDPLVSLKASDVTLRYVLDRLCAEADWTYEEGMEGHWFFFHPPRK
jgi:hypothetical protein